MSHILYYSNYCNKCKTLITDLSKINVTNMLYICIDSRFKTNNGDIHIKLKNGKTMLLPPSVDAVPALLLMESDQVVLKGGQIYNYFNEQFKQQTPVEELGCYSFGDSEIVSDCYSDYNMSAFDLSSKGNGGLQNMHGYVGANDVYFGIHTPKEDGLTNKIKDQTMSDQMSKIRDNDPYTKIPRSSY